jgi:hypothetical protein
MGVPTKIGFFFLGFEVTYRYDLGIMGIMSVAGGCLTRKKTQECLYI